MTGQRAIKVIPLAHRILLLLQGGEDGDVITVAEISAQLREPSTAVVKALAGLHSNGFAAGDAEGWYVTAEGREQEVSSGSAPLIPAAAQDPKPTAVVVKSEPRIAEVSLVTEVGPGVEPMRPAEPVNEPVEPVNEPPESVSDKPADNPQPEDQTMPQKLSTFATSIMLELTKGPASRDELLARLKGARPTGLGRSLPGLKVLGLVKEVGEQYSLTVAGQKWVTEHTAEDGGEEKPAPKKKRRAAAAAEPSAPAKPADDELAAAGLNRPIVAFTTHAVDLNHLRIVRQVQQRSKNEIERKLLGEVFDILLGQS